MDNFHEEQTAKQAQPFLVEDKDETEKACITCNKYKIEKDNKKFICGTYKYRENHRLREGLQRDDDTFSCTDYVEI